MHYTCPPRSFSMHCSKNDPLHPLFVFPTLQLPLPFAPFFNNDLLLSLNMSEFTFRPTSSSLLRHQKCSAAAELAISIVPDPPITKIVSIHASGSAWPLLSPSLAFFRAKMSLVKPTNCFRSSPSAVTSDVTYRSWPSPTQLKD